MALKTGLVLLAYAVIFINILIALASGVLYWIKTGDGKPAFNSVAEPIFGADVAVAKNCVILGNETLQMAYPDKYDKDYLDYLRSDTLHNLFIFGLMFFVLFKGWEFVYGAANNENKVMAYFGVIMTTIISLAFFEVVYSLINGGGWVVPLKGILWDFPKVMIDGGFLSLPNYVDVGVQSFQNVTGNLTA